jgi:predicted HNH restriction endonuclease
MNVHHIGASEDNNPKNLMTSCVACHAVLHIRLNLSHQVIEIWEANISQLEIVQKPESSLELG